MVLFLPGICLTLGGSDLVSFLPWDQEVHETGCYMHWGCKYKIISKIKCLILSHQKYTNMQTNLLVQHAL